ncbi:hypothetical protein DPMN_092995 [Dreissena polymorpha]|uniref:Uncharacterized protein n=2 Tax=Dreissena polymorpha TaxID=45954 RepID=A0A9D4R1E1_DREPO|nr:hypothetical protein DPMN_092995 [Dreissena polymorpha]
MSTDCAQCKWANENCERDKQCCSGRCVSLHTGTTPRCGSSPLNYPCFFGYQCEQGLDCDNLYRCCAPFWAMCSNTQDCCDDSHICRHEYGIMYKRCLMSAAERPHAKASRQSLVLLSVVLLLTFRCHITF